MDVTVQRIEGTSLPTRCTPVVGSVTLEFVERKLAQRGAPDREAMDRIVAEAAQILGRCVPPKDSAGCDAGLVVGYVQSGKTLSFTTVAALARDNGFGAVILLAGTAVSLKGQSEKRLTIDLGLEDTQHDWRHFENPDPTKNDHTEIDKVLRNWRKTLGSAPGTIAVTVLPIDKVLWPARRDRSNRRFPRQPLGLRGPWRLP